MASDNASGSPPNRDLVDVSARRRGRMGLTITWENIPWWGIIILLVGVFVGYSALTSTRYVDALRFIFDLPWTRDVVARDEVAEDGTWSLTVWSPLAPGRYTLFVDVEDGETKAIERSADYTIEVPEGAPEVEAAPITQPSDTPVLVNTSTPTIAGTAKTGGDVLLWDDFAGQPLRILARMATANGVMLTLRVTLIGFAGALVTGLVFGLMRVSSRSPDLTVNLWRRLLIGVVVIVLIWVLKPDWRGVRSIALVVIGVEAVMFLLPTMPYTISTIYVEVVRGVPMLVIILYMGFAVTPALRAATNEAVDLRGVPAAVIGLSFGYGAYLAEVFRAGIQSVPRGQMEAARSLGMGYFKAMRHIILPQAIRVVLPPLGNDFISMLKDSSLISVIALPEVLQQGRLWISRNFRAFEGYNSVMMTYLVMTLLLSLLVRTIERRSALPGH